MTELTINYQHDGIHIAALEGGHARPKELWLDLGVGTTVYNVVTDLQVNEIVVPDSHGFLLPYESLVHADRRDLDDIGVAPAYPYDIFISFAGPSFLGEGTRFEYTFQDYAGLTGTGNILATAKTRQGAYLNIHGGFILSDTQFRLAAYLDLINSEPAESRTERLERAAKIQELAAEANAVVSKSMHDRIVEIVDQVDVDIEQVGADQFRLLPKIQGENGASFTDAVSGSRRPKSSYIDRKGGKTVEFAVTGVTPEGIRLSDELGKLMQTYSQSEINDIVRDPSAKFDTDLLNLDLFGKRVVELGLYKPRFYPFISSYQSAWVPGVSIEDPLSGTRRIAIQNDEVLAEFAEAIQAAKANASAEVHYKSENLPLEVAEELFAVAKEQLRDTSRPIVDEESAEGQADEKEGKKVLIIKENIEELDYSAAVEDGPNSQIPLQTVRGLHPGIALKQHQREGVQWLQNMLGNDGAVPGVLLADDMGLGKTLQVIYFIEWYASISKKPILIVAPVSLLENWEAEYRKFFPNPTYTVHRVWGSEAKQFIVPGQLTASKALLSRQGIYLTTYETMRHKQLYFAAVDWGLVVMDEVQKIKTPGTMVTNSAKALKSDFRVAMTGTPVENSLMDLWCIMDFCYPGLLQDAKSFSKIYIDPQGQADTDKVELGEKLRNRIGDKLKRRLKIDVAKDLPSITYHVLEREMPHEQFQRYVSVLNKTVKQREEGKGQQGAFEVLFAIKQISDHPYCKIMDLERVSVDRLVQTSAKLTTTVGILNDIMAANEKAIIFTENREIQRMLRRVVSRLFGYEAAIVNGATPSSTTKKSKKLSRQDHINAYQAAPGFGVIIMSPIAAGFGLNVTGANHVIHYTRHWNPAKEQQATDRAYRIGQDKPVHVYYPLAVAPDDAFQSFDLVLDGLLRRKRELADVTLFPSDLIEVSQEDVVRDITTQTVVETEGMSISTLEEMLSLSQQYQLGAVASLLERKFGGEAKVLKSRKYGCDLIWVMGGTVSLCQIIGVNQVPIPIATQHFTNPSQGEAIRMGVSCEAIDTPDFFENVVFFDAFAETLKERELLLVEVERRLYQ